MTVPILKWETYQWIKKGTCIDHGNFLQEMFVQHDRHHKEKLSILYNPLTKNIFHKKVAPSKSGETTFLIPAISMQNGHSFKPFQAEVFQPYQWFRHPDSVPHHKIQQLVQA